MIEAAVHYYKATGKTITVGSRHPLYKLHGRLYGTSTQEKYCSLSLRPEEAIIKLYWLFKEQPELKKQLSVSVNEDAYRKLATFWMKKQRASCGYPLWLTWGKGKSENGIRDAQYNAPELASIVVRHGEIMLKTQFRYLSNKPLKDMPYAPHY